MGRLIEDVRYGVRFLRKTPGFSALVVLTLAWAVGSCIATFSVINAFLLRPLPFHKSETLVHVWGTDRQQRQTRLRLSLPDFLDLRERGQGVVDLAAFTYAEETLTGVAEPEVLVVAPVSANLWNVLGVGPALGRAFHADEDQPGRAPVAIVSDRLWKRRFGGDPSALGRTIELDDVAYSIVGIMAPQFAFPLNTVDLWMPQVIDTERHARDQRFLQAVGRLNPGMTRPRAQAALLAVTKQLEQEHPQEDANHGVRLVPLREALNFAFDVLQPMMVVLSLANFLALLVVCSNVAGLTLSLALTRLREVAIRKAIGCTRIRLIRQLLTESLLLSLAGGALGILLATWTLEGAARAIPDNLYRVGSIDIDGTALGFTFVLSLCAALLFGFMPAWHLSRTDILEHLNDTATALTPSRRSGRVRGLLVLSQVALASMLLTAATLLVLTLVRLQRVDPGFVANGVLTMKVRVPGSRYTAPGALARFEEALLTRVRAVPGVVSVASATSLPLDHETADTPFYVGDRAAPTAKRPVANLAIVSPEYFRTLGISLVAGRPFAESDSATSAPVGIVNERIARQYWPDGDPVGRQLRVGGAGRDNPVTIIAVASDARLDSLRGEIAPQVYRPQAQTPTRHLALIIRGDGDVLTLAPDIRRAVANTDRSLVISDARTLAAVVDAFVAPERTLVRVLGRVAIGALLLLIVGVYGIVAQAVARRTHEIGIRIALGASRESIMALVMRQALIYLASGLAVGLIGALGLGRAVAHLFIGTTDMTLLLGLSVLALVAAVALLACCIPARRAVTVDPVSALRSL